MTEGRDRIEVSRDGHAPQRVRDERQPRGAPVLAQRLAYAGEIVGYGDLGDDDPVDR